MIPISLLLILLVYWIGMSYLAVKMNLSTFQKYAKYGKLINQKPQWSGLIRKDFQQWQKKKIIIGSLTMFPIKFFALANFLVGALLFSIGIAILKEGSLKRKLCKACVWYFNNYGKLMNNIAVSIQDNCPTIQLSKIKTPIIISNHSCWFDTFYITLKYSPVSFVAKYQIQFWPVIGPCSKALNCIFVKRESGDDRNNVKNLIKKRIDDFYDGKFQASPLVLYPEGTTSNNRVILNFKNGAFENMSPITIICLKYECQDFLFGEDELEQYEHVFLMLSQKTKLKATKIQISPQPNQTSQTYMQRCRDLMSKTLNFPKVNAGYRDRLQIQKLRKEARKLN